MCIVASLGGVGYKISCVTTNSNTRKRRKKDEYTWVVLGGQREKERQRERKREEERGREKSEWKLSMGTSLWAGSKAGEAVASEI